MYVVKVGEYYVKGYVGSSGRMDKAVPYEIVLSKELMRGYDKTTAEKIAKATNGVIEEIADQVTMSEEKYKQLSIFDEEVTNAES